MNKLPYRNLLLLTLTLLLGGITHTQASLQKGYEAAALEYATGYLLINPQTRPTQQDFFKAKDINGLPFGAVISDYIKWGDFMLKEGISVKSPYFKKILKDAYKTGALNLKNPWRKYSGVSIEITSNFFNKTENLKKLDEQFSDYLKKNEIVGDQFVQTLKLCVNIGINLIEDGISPKDKPFSALLKSCVESELKTDKVPTVLVSNEFNDRKKLWNLGFEEIAEKSKGYREDLIKLNNIEKEEFKQAFEKQEFTNEFDKPAKADRMIMGIGLNKLEKVNELKKLNPKAKESALANVRTPSQTTDSVLKYFQFGYRKSSPYSIVETPAQQDANVDTATSTANSPKSLSIEKADDNSTPFLEFVYANSWAWNEQRLLKHRDGVKHKFLKSFRDPLDFGFRLSYNFNSEENQTIATLTGSSQIDLESNIGVNLLRHRFQDNSAISIALEWGYAASTDSSSFEVNTREFTGLAFKTSFFPFDNQKRKAHLVARVGEISIDTVSYIDESSTQINTTRGGLPKFSKQKGQAFEAELLYPIGDKATVSLVGRIYSGLNPDTWAVQIAYSQSISDLLGGVFSGVGSNKDKE